MDERDSEARRTGDPFAWPRVRADRGEAMVDEFTVDADTTGYVGITDPIIGYHVIEAEQIDAAIEDITATSLPDDYEARISEMGRVLEGWSSV